MSPKWEGRPTMKTRSATRRAAAALAVTAAMVLAACGDDGDSGDSADEPAAIDPDADLSGQEIVVTNWADYMPPDIAKIAMPAFNEYRRRTQNIPDPAERERIQKEIFSTLKLPKATISKRSMRCFARS